MQPAKHGPNRLTNYRQVHDAVMGQLADRGFVCADNLELTPLSGGFRMRGQIACRGGLVVDVDKVLKIVGDASDDLLVQTVRYSYNVSVRGWHNLLRHDNAHVHPGHGDEHHRHDFDWRTASMAAAASRRVSSNKWP